MDHFGIGAGVMGAVNVYLTCGRRSGRTTSLIESVKDGDRIIFAEPGEADRVRRLIKERGIDVECIVVNPGDPIGIPRLSTSPDDGRTILDHTWVERYYEAGIKRLARNIDNIQEGLSGYGAKHRETKRAAEEIARWQAYRF